MVQRGEDADQREQRRAQVGDRHAGLDRRSPFGGAGHRHQARETLRDQIEAALGRPRAGLAVAGDRGVDQPRVLAAQRVVVEAEARHHARPVVLDEDVGAAGQPLEDARGPSRR